jgi:hypothetical protein
MAVLRIVRFTTDPAQADKMLATRAGLIAATRDRFEGLTTPGWPGWTSARGSTSGAGSPPSTCSARSTTSRPSPAPARPSP